jgi:protein involved in polysaccharide export with SLBB domain
MKWISLFPNRWIVLSSLLLLAGVFSGCETASPPPPPPSNPANSSSTTGGGASPISADILRPGDRIKIIYNDIPDAPTPTEQIIPEDGKILLPRGIEVEVAGKKRTDVEREIAKIYVEDKRIYTKITVTIERMVSFVSVGGEVRSPNSIVYRGDLTVLAAIDAAGGFTEFAKRSDVIVTRAATKQQIHVNAKRAVRDPQLNLGLFPGDSVYVPRSWL